VPRSGRYGAGGKTWRHISQSGRVPPDRRLTDDIGGQYGGRPAFQRRPPFTDKLAIKAGRIQPVQKTLECLLLANSTHVGVRRGPAAFYQKADVGNRKSAFQRISSA
jgi:hypothetical protein